jgi:hypothetical protein
VIYLTNYRLVFKLDKPTQKNIARFLSNFPKDYFDVPLFLINKIEQGSNKKSNSKFFVEINT